MEEMTVYGQRPRPGFQSSVGPRSSGFNVGGSNRGGGGLFGPGGAMVLPAFQAQPTDLLNMQNVTPMVKLRQLAQKYGLSEQEAQSLLEKFGGDIGATMSALAQGVGNVRALLRGEITLQNFRDKASGAIENVKEQFEETVDQAQEFLSDPVGETRDMAAEGFQNVGNRLTEAGSNKKFTKWLPGKGKLIRGIGDFANRVGETIEGQANGGIMSLKDGGESDLRNIAKKRSAEVYGDPVMFERFAPSPLQVQNPAFRGSQFFMPPGEVPNFNMGIMGLPGQMYGNYYPAGSVGQMNPLNKRVMGMPGGAQMPPPPGSEPAIPPPSQDTGMTGEVWDKKYEDVVPKPKRADFAEGPYQGREGSEAFQRALDAWNKNQKIWDSFETGAERKEHYIGDLDFSNLGFADGGSTNFPRKNGQIAGPGTERSDDIPAMLSDGEFVVNAKAVRGIGSLMGPGKPKSKAEQRREGARAMYALQNAGEKASGLRG